MARKPGVCPAGVAQHIIQRGNNRQVCFGDESDFVAYAHWLREAGERWGVGLQAWVFMTHPVHLLVTPGRSAGGVGHDAGSRPPLRAAFQSWVAARRDAVGGAVRVVPGAGPTVLAAMRPLYRAESGAGGMVADPGECRWSSDRANALDVESSLRTPHPEYLALGGTSSRLTWYRALFKARADHGLLTDLRRVTERVLAPGDSRFVEAMERLTGR